MAAEHAVLQFQTLQSAVDATFWTKLKELKLDQLGLSEAPLPLRGWYSLSQGTGVPPALHVDQGSFEGTGASPPYGVLQDGIIHNVNSLDAFRAFDRQAAAHQVAQQIWQNIRSGKALEQPTALNRFLLLTYADLKHYKFFYWFSFIALKPPVPFTSSPAVSLAAAFGDGAADLVESCEQWTATAASSATRGSSVEHQPFWLVVLRPGSCVACLPLAKWQEVLPSDPAAEAQDSGNGGTQAPGVLLACADAGSAPAHPAWPLRNALLAAAAKIGLRRLQVVCLRLQGGQPNAEASLLFNVQLPEIPEGWCQGEGEAPAALGWEAGARGKAAPRQVDLSEAMDPVKQAEGAADLNLKLMKWRAAPSLDLGCLAATKCLLLGAGGCPNRKI